MNIRHWFLPAKINKFHPHALRPVGLALFLIVFISIPFLYNVTSAQQMQVLGYATSISVGELNSLSNQERLNNGLPSLNLNGQLNSAAAAKANDMFAKDYWAHVAPDGTTPWSFIYAAGYNYSSAGENLAKDFNTSAGVVAGWMGSSAHRANVLNGSYQDVGYAVVNGVLQGSETTLVVAMYGAPVAPAPPPPPAPAAQVQPQPSAPTSTPSQPAPKAVVPADPAATKTTPVEKKKTASEKKTDTSTQTKQEANSTSPASENAGLIKGISTSLPVRTYQALNWGQKTSLALVSVLMLLFIMKHTIIWRQQKRGFRDIWLRAHPIAQTAMLASVVIVTVATSIGSVL